MAEDRSGSPGQPVRGLVVTDVVPGGPGAIAGFLPGDVLTTIGSLQVSDLLAQAKSVVPNVSVPGVILNALRRFPPGTRLRFQVLRGTEPLSLTAELGAPTADQVRLSKKREEALQQLAQVGLAERSIVANNTSAENQSRLTGSLGPLLREYKSLLRTVLTTSDEARLRSALGAASNDKRLEVLHGLISVLESVRAHNTLVCCNEAEQYRVFDKTLKEFLPPEFYFNKTLESANLQSLNAMRWTLRFVEPYGDAKARLVKVDKRIAIFESGVALASEVASIKLTLQSAPASGFNDPGLDARIDRLPDDARRSIEEYKTQLTTGQKQAEATERQRRKETEAREGEWRKSRETTEAGFQQLKETKRKREEWEQAGREAQRQTATQKAQQLQEASRREQEGKARERAKELARYGAEHLSSGDDLHDNPFKFRGQAVGLTNVTFERMIEPGLGVFGIRAGRTLLISGLPLDSFGQAGQTGNLIVRVIGTRRAKNALGGESILTHLEYLALLP